MHPHDGEGAGDADRELAVQPHVERLEIGLNDSATERHRFLFQYPNAYPLSPLNHIVSGVKVHPFRCAIPLGGGDRMTEESRGPSRG